MRKTIIKIPQKDKPAKPQEKRKVGGKLHGHTVIPVTGKRPTQLEPIIQFIGVTGRKRKREIDIRRTESKGRTTREADFEKFSKFIRKKGYELIYIKKPKKGEKAVRIVKKDRQPFKPVEIELLKMAIKGFKASYKRDIGKR